MSQCHVGVYWRHSLTGNLEPHIDKDKFEVFRL